MAAVQKTEKTGAGRGPLRLSAILVPAMAALALNACASRESRIESGLVDLGVPRGMSSCMANRMVDNLSSSQIRQVARFADSMDRDIDRMRVGEIVDRFGGIGDPQIVSVVGRAAAGCAISG